MRLHGHVERLCQLGAHHGTARPLVRFHERCLRCFRDLRAAAAREGEERVLEVGRQSAFAWSGVSAHGAGGLAHFGRKLKSHVAVGTTFNDVAATSRESKSHCASAVTVPATPEPRPSFPATSSMKPVACGPSKSVDCCLSASEQVITSVLVCAKILSALS